MMLAQIERCMEANARLDAYRAAGRGRPGIDHPVETGEVIGKRIDVALARISREMNRLTVERLDADLERKQRRMAS